MFFIIPIGVDYNARRYPVVTFSLMGICTAVFLASFFHSWDNPEAREWWRQNLWLIPATSPWYTYFTSIFVHGGFLHLIGNMVYLFLFGSCVEDIMGRWRYLAFYLIGGLVAAFSHIALTPEHFGSAIALGGASGAISACMGGFVLLLLRTKIEFKWIIFFFFRLFSGEFKLPAWLVLSFWFGEDVLGMWLDLHDGPDENGGTAFGAHIGGFVVGMLMVALLKPVLRREEAKADDDEPVARPAKSAPVPAATEEPTILLFDSGNQLGPFTQSQISQMVKLGSVSREAVYWSDGMTDWRSVEEIL